MSKPRYDWWPYVCRVVQNYPAKKERIDALLKPNMGTTYDGQPHGSGVSSPVESLVVRVISSTDYRDVMAVEQAIEKTKHMRWGKQRLDVLRMVYWDKTHTLQGAALKVSCSYTLVRQWSIEFKYLVGNYMGFEKCGL